MRSLVLIVLAIFFGISAQAVPTHGFFAKDIKFDAHVPLPEAYLGYEIGDWHISPDALNGYMRELAGQSSRVSIETIGYSHERKALTHVYISSPQNISNLDKVLAKHQNAKSAAEDILVVNLSYSIHGNEASGSNAAPLVAYYLAASQEKWVTDMLASTVVIIEPSQNPDGLARFAVWANQHQGKTANYDNANRDHFEPWPTGRTNHYWFDLNRDWIFTVHPESKARVKAYQEWKPHVLGDYHEMGGDFRSYFFQPGHVKRTNPLTNPLNQKITLDLARYHAKALDARAQPYFTEERFDDFYYGKGSTYPDATGNIGVLFEQSSVRGHARNIGGEKIKFAFGIGNHLATSIPLVRGSHSERDEILAYRFNNQVVQARAAKTNPVKAYVFSDDGDPGRAKMFLDILGRHNIPVYSLSNDFYGGKQSFNKRNSYVVKLDDPQYGLIKSLFETRTKFEDDVFYDISSWNMPLAYNLPYAPLKNLAKVGQTPITPNLQSMHKEWTNNHPVAYAYEWNQYHAPHLLQALISSELHPRVTTKPISAQTQDHGLHDFPAGAIIIEPNDGAGHEKLAKIFTQHSDIKVYGLTTGLTEKGPDLGSRDVKVLAPIRPVLLVGKGIQPTEAGAIRYAVENRFGIPLTILDANRLQDTDLSKYTHILLADGSYNSWKSAPKILKDWVKSGGTIVAQKRAANWMQTNVIGLKVNSKKSNKTTTPRPYQNYENDMGKKRIAGAVLRTHADLTHPLMFGYTRADIPVLFNGRYGLAKAPISYDMPLNYGDDDLLITGYADDAQLKTLENTPALALHRMGRGKIVLLSHDANFRAFWLGTERSYANALFFTQAIDYRRD